MNEAINEAGDERRTYAKSLAKGFVAGLIGGLIGTAAKSVAEKIYPPRIHGEPEPDAALAGHALTVDKKEAAAETIHWGFGALAGAAYGVAAEFYPAATGKDGAAFGMTLASLTHEKALPVLGLSAAAEEQTTRERSSEIASHIVYGMVTEAVRDFVRRILR